MSCDVTMASMEAGRVYFAPGWNGLEQGILLENPARTLSTEIQAEIPTLLAECAREASSGRTVAGFLSYEAGASFESSVPSRESDLPLLWMGVYDYVAVDGAPALKNPAEIRNPRFSISPDAHGACVTAARRRIREGDVYQINFTGQLHFEVAGRPFDLFATLIRRQPVPYGAFIDLGETQILSLSPELFFHRRGEHIVTRPMKGTARRGGSPDEDERLQEWLAGDEKSRAENLMIVDLLRNDLSRVCRSGTVRVASLFKTERYETLLQLTSEVEGLLRPGVGNADIFRALFPCGSVTGAPKIRAMQIIQELEEHPRGVYCGAIGFMHGDEALFNVAIRTAVVREGRGRLGIGSGIVWDSDPSAEYEECLLKARFLTDAVSPRNDLRLIESMRWSEGEITLLDLHLARLKNSAAELDFPFNRAAIMQRIGEATLQLDSRNAYKVRLTLGSGGDVEVAGTAVENPPATWRVKIASARIDASDVYRRHKTTRREVYDAAYREAQLAGFDEVIFLNEDGEVAEGSRTNIVVAEEDAWWTPPVDSGALPGVFREHLMRSGANLRERVLYIDDLLEAPAVYLCNAVIGLVTAHLVYEGAPVPDRVVRVSTVPTAETRVTK